MDSLEIAQDIVRVCLQLDVSFALDRHTQLLGAFPEFNSLTITSIVASIEEQLDCEIKDTEIGGEYFENIGTLADFIESKM